MNDINYLPPRTIIYSLFKGNTVIVQLQEIPLRFKITKKKKKKLELSEPAPIPPRPQLHNSKKQENKSHNHHKSHLVS